VEACSPDYRLGVRDETVPGTFVDNPGLLTGAAGVALVLLATATPVLPEWDRLFLLT
jgi:lantibiotic biosynthesis protein